MLTFYVHKFSVRALRATSDRFGLRIRFPSERAA
jgi:hypothetical protein